MDSDRVGLGDLDSLLHLCVCFTDRTVSVLLSNALLSVVDSLCSGFLTESCNVSGLVADIGYVNVDKAETYLLKLGLNVGADSRQELISVGVDLLDVHGCDDQTELTENDILGELLDLGELESKQTLSSVLHNTGLGGDTDGKS